ncbi:Protein CBG03376 [Caenorhabditis briggsae]|uniref:Protein CBG03376 n=1 Tax=Caenorhabditis briggsae TaxID=6238 RepID=A8WUW6_CAEBR|nr:Protein CBG03376 [Caenorhabditis briggsae]CAP24277.2 Protein CBG03376 [Caenorhabditis briggsae]
MEERKPEKYYKTEDNDPIEYEEVFQNSTLVKKYHFYVTMSLFVYLFSFSFFLFFHLFLTYEQNAYSSVERYNEELAMRFFLGNGRSLETINDPPFLKFLHHLNPTRNPPEPSYMTTRAMTETRPDIKYLRNLGPLGITIEAVRKADEIYLSISSHFYNSHGERQNTVHFEKIIFRDYDGRIVADRIRKVVDARKAMNYAVSYIMSPNCRMLEMITANMPVKNKFICVFSYLTMIANEVVKFPEFLAGLKVLREYVSALQKHREVFTKFKKMQKDANDSADIPCLDVEGDWLSTLYFLASCSHLHETFSNIHENWCMPNYLDATEENSLANLLDFLLVLCRVTSEICSEDSCISQALYSISMVHNSIKKCGIKSARERMRKTFDKYYKSMTKDRSGDYLTVSSLLDPRYAYSTLIFNEENWNLIEKKLIKLFEPSQLQQQGVKNELKDYRQLHENLPVFDEVTTPTTWWNDHRDQLPLMHRQWIEHSALPAVAIDGKRFFAKGGKLAHLFATLDEELHYKAMLLAQSSQDFIGRGSMSSSVLNQITEGCKFKRLDHEPDSLEEETTEPVAEVKLEPTDETSENSKLVETELKQEEPNDF